MSWKKIIAIVVLLVIGLLTALLFWPLKAPRRSLPEPNGYEALIAAAERLTSLPSETNPPMEDLRAYVNENRDSLNAIKDALELECMVTTQFDSPDYILMHMPRMMEVKKAALALGLEGRLAEADGKFDQAATIYLCAIQLGQNVTRNGLLIDMLSGVACERVGARSLSLIVTNLPAETCFVIVQQLDKWEQSREPMNSIQENETYYERSQYFWPSIQVRFMHLITQGRLGPNFDKSWVKYAEQSNATKLLMTRLAAHAYEFQHGRKPQSFDDLVPEYLPTRPTDYLSGTNLVYDFGK